MIWPLIGVNYEELRKMETRKCHVCNGMFGSFRVDRKSQTRIKTAALGISVSCHYGEWCVTI